MQEVLFFLCLLTLPVTFNLLFPYSLSSVHKIEQQNESGWVKHKGLYRNHVYNFSVFIPKGKIGISSRPPNPDHGIKIMLDEADVSHLWATAIYDSTGLGSLDNIVADQLKSFTADKKIIVKSINSTMTVKRRLATRLTIEYKSDENTEVMVQDSIYILKKPVSKGSDTGTLYELVLITQKQNYLSHKQLLESMLKSWEIK